MMRQFRTIYALAAVVLLSLPACSSDVTEEQGGGVEPVKDELLQVRLRISPASSATPGTRATWQDNWAEDNEMMNLWTVVIVDDATDKVVQVQSCRPSTPYAEIDDVTTLPSGKYRFYSFANISADNVESLLGLTAGAVPVIDKNSTDAIESKNVENFTPPTGGTSETGMGEVGGANSNNPATSINATINGNNFNPDAAGNGLGEKGIPMCNVQTYTISSSGSYDLIVIRMLAKIELRLFNVTGNDVKVKSITLSDVTKNESGNLYLLPSLTNTTGNTPNELQYTHKDIQPHVNASDREDVVLTYASGLTVSKDYSSPIYEKGTDKYESVVFYVNESTAPSNPDGLFKLTLELDNDDYRYSLISQKGSTTADDNAWDYIARNDYRVIPIVLDDYRLEIIPYDFPEIGVYPASVKTIDATKHLYQMDFHDYGHFHLVPRVVKGTGASATVVPFSQTSAGTRPFWTLKGAGAMAAEADWTNAFKSYTDEAGTTVYDADYNKTTATGTETRMFYGKPGASGFPADNVYPTTLPKYLTAVDASENGDFPVLDTQTTWNGYNASSPTTAPYIFGQIAPQVAGADKKVFHEFKAYLYVGEETTPRELTYRFYMHLKQDHAAARKAGTRCCDHD